MLSDEAIDDLMKHLTGQVPLTVDLARVFMQEALIELRARRGAEIPTALVDSIDSAQQLWEQWRDARADALISATRLYQGMPGAANSGILARADIFAQYIMEGSD